MVRGLSGVMALLCLVLSLVSFTAYSAWRSAIDTNARLDRNLIYLKCSFEHINEGQQRISRGLPVEPSHCVPSHK